MNSILNTFIIDGNVINALTKIDEVTTKNARRKFIHGERKHIDRVEVVEVVE